MSVGALCFNSSGSCSLFMNYLHINKVGIKNKIKRMSYINRQLKKKVNTMILLLGREILYKAKQTKMIKRKMKTHIRHVKERREG